MKCSQIIGNYKLFKTIGEGAFAKVRRKNFYRKNILIYSWYQYHNKSKNCR